MSGPLTPAEVEATGAWIASVQLPNGMIPWFPGGHADPWNHIEATMALLRAGRRRDADRALDWLASRQHADGSWCLYYLAEGVTDPRRDPNVCAYIATGTWWHYLDAGDIGVLADLWPVVEAAIEFVLRLQRPGGEVAWSLDVDGTPGRYALVTGSSSIHKSLRCAVEIAETLGYERPEWELAADRLAWAVTNRPEAFVAKDRWAMDWYYPVLGGAVAGAPARQRLEARWDDFVMDGLGVRCVADHAWVTGAETAECAMALDAAGMGRAAAWLLDWTRHHRDADGGYWTGCVHPQCVRFPGGERSTYTAAAVLLADHVIYGSGPTAAFFRPSPAAVLDLTEVADPVAER